MQIEGRQYDYEIRIGRSVYYFAQLTVAQWCIEDEIRAGTKPEDILMKIVEVVSARKREESKQ